MPAQVIGAVRLAEDQLVDTDASRERANPVLDIKRHVNILCNSKDVINSDAKCVDIRAAAVVRPLTFGMSSTHVPSEVMGMRAAQLSTER